MKFRLASVATALATMTLVVGVGTAEPAGAAVVACGQTITQNTTLDADVGPCSNGGIVIGASNITLDLGEHTVFGSPGTGDGAGIFIFRKTGVTVKNGTVRGFDGGVAIEGGSGNTVTGITATENAGRSPGSNYGDGIAILSSTGNRILRNTLTNNSPFAGIGIYSLIDSDHPRATGGQSSGNLIEGNTVDGNKIGRTGNLFDTDNDGIRLEPQSVGNSIVNNTITDSGLDGIALFNGSANNNVRGNEIHRNGLYRTSARHGSGIIVFARANGNFIDHNHLTGNGDNGIVLMGPIGSNPGTLGNRVTYNNSTGNAALPTLPSPAFGTAAYDLQDRNANCGGNQWWGNTYHAAFPICTTAGGTQV